MNDQDDRPKCVGCRGALKLNEASRLVCYLCEDSVREDLEELAGPTGLFAQLVWAGADALTPGSNRSSSDPVVKMSKTTAPDPVRMQAMNLLGRGGVVNTLQRWVKAWYDGLGFSQPIWSGQHHFVVMVSPSGNKVRRPGQLDNTVKALMNNLPWAVEHRDDFGSFAKDVHRMVEDSRRAIDPTAARPVRVYVGKCPNEVNGLICSAKLMADPFAMHIRCANCGTSWPRADWSALGEQTDRRPRS
jgi:hypothetical protein